MSLQSIAGIVISCIPNSVFKKIEKKVFSKPNYKEFIETSNSVFDVGLVFGGNINRAKKAFELYKNKKIKKILLSGGIGIGTGKTQETEAERYKKIALEEGIPEEDIIIEKTSRNTDENVKNSKKILKSLGYDLEKTSILVISSDYHVERCLQILNDTLPKTQINYDSFQNGNRTHLNITEDALSRNQLSYVAIKTSDTWKNSRHGKFYIFKEYCRKIKKH